MSTPDTDCFFCQAAENEADADSLVVCRGSAHLVMLNRYPYTNGHLMVVPLEHTADPQSSSVEARTEFWPLVLRCQAALSSVYAPDGFNMGLNLGSAAGAGVPSHYHFHIVPRWEGDTNFMSTLGGVRLVPEEPSRVAEKLRPVFAEE